ncbi:MAG: hypothetical protein NC218_02595, partial [Acetobacter sp.]|nr:hypothetical protein [Acetobacter sp.]
DNDIMAITNVDAVTVDNDIMAITNVDAVTVDNDDMGIILPQGVYKYDEMTQTLTIRSSENG